MGAAEHFRVGIRRSRTVMAGAVIVALALLIGAMLLPATAEAKVDSRAPRLTVQRLVSEVVPGKGDQVILAYSTNEAASIIVVVARLAPPPASREGSRVRTYTNGITGRPSYITRGTSPSAYLMDCARGGMLLVLHGENGAVYWDGTTACGDCAPGGTYWVQITATDAAANTSAPQNFFLTVPDIE